MIFYLFISSMFNRSRVEIRIMNFIIFFNVFYRSQIIFQLCKSLASLVKPGVIVMEFKHYTSFVIVQWLYWNISNAQHNLYVYCSEITANHCYSFVCYFCHLAYCHIYIYCIFTFDRWIRKAQTITCSVEKKLVQYIEYINI